MTTTLDRDLAARLWCPASALPPNYVTGFFPHSPKPRPDGCAMSDAKSGLIASLVGRHRSPSPGKLDESVALLRRRGTNGEGITKSRKLFAFFIRHDALLQSQGGTITLLEPACGAHAARRIQTRNLSDRKR